LSGLLQRLAGQALGANAKGTSGNAPRIRPAATVQAQMPLAVATEIEAAPAATLEAPRLNEARNTHSQATHPPAPRESRAEPVPRSPHHIKLETPRVETPQAAAARRVAAPAVAQPAVRKTAHRAPPALLSEMPETTAVASSAAIMPLLPPRIAEAASTRAATEPTEVHVHIGRIEVIAPPGPATQEKKLRIARDTLPLGEYLARRRQS
jgi:hypothetical protein